MAQDTAPLDKANASFTEISKLGDPLVSPATVTKEVAPRLKASQSHNSGLERFESRVETIIQKALQSGSALQQPNNEGSVSLRINGIEDGVLRAIMAHAAIRPQCILFAVTGVQSPEQIPQTVHPISTLMFSEDQAKESLKRRDSADFYGRAAMQYTLWHLWSEETPQKSEDFAKMNASATDKANIIKTYRKIKAGLAAEFEENYRKMVAMGRDELIRSE